jgi:hypothetical protein
MVSPKHREDEPMAWLEGMLPWLEGRLQSCNEGLLHLLTLNWFVAWGIPLTLAVINGGWRAMAKPNGPLLGVILNVPSLARADRAIGFDLIFAGLGSQLGFMAVTALDGGESPEANFTGFWVTIVVAALLVPFVRVFGYERTSNRFRLRQEWGVALPNLIGTIVLIVVYNANT